MDDGISRRKERWAAPTVAYLSNIMMFEHWPVDLAMWKLLETDEMFQGVSHEIKRRLLLGRKAMTNLDSILKSRNITLPTKVCLVKAMVFPVVMYGYESWTIKKAERQRIDAFELWCWRRLLRESLGLQGDPTSPFWRRSALGLLWKEWCWSWNCSTLATSCEELTHWKRLWCWEGLGAGGEGNDRGWDGWMASLTRWTWI